MQSSSPGRNPFSNLFKEKLRERSFKNSSEAMKETSKLWNEMSPQQKTKIKEEAEQSLPSQSLQMRYALEEHSLGPTGRRQLSSFKAAVDVYMANMIAMHIDKSISEER